MADISPSELIEGSLVDHIRQLELFSRFRVESFLTGPNKSPFKGFTSDFLQHRQYFRGDSLKHLDWRVFGKTGKFHIKMYEELTNARIGVILDTSASMRYKGPDSPFSKHEFAVRSAALIFYLAFLHKDSFALTVFNTHATATVPFRSGRKHLRRVLRGLVEATPEGGTDFPNALAEATAPIRRKGLTIVLSDCMGDPEQIVRVMSRLRYAGSDVIAMQIYDPAEREFDFNSITRFHDLESRDILVLDPLALRRAYQETFDQHQVEMRNLCQRHGFDHALLPVSDDYDVPLLEYVRRRMEMFS